MFFLFWVQSEISFWVSTIIKFGSIYSNEEGIMPSESVNVQPWSKENRVVC